MNVEHRLARFTIRVEDGPITAIGVPVFFRDLCSSAMHLAYKTIIS